MAEYKITIKLNVSKIDGDTAELRTSSKRKAIAIVESLKVAGHTVTKVQMSKDVNL